jgi:isopropylmalate/homocitrate/citramalate synthase
MSKDPGRILIFDTTLRDGEQSPGARNENQTTYTHIPKKQKTKTRK